MKPLKFLVGNFSFQAQYDIPPLIRVRHLALQRRPWQGVGGGVLGGKILRLGGNKVPLLVPARKTGVRVDLSGKADQFQFWKRGISRRKTFSFKRQFNQTCST